MTTCYIAIGLRRKRNDTCLDVYFPEIKKVEINDSQLNEINKRFVSKSELTVELETQLTGKYSDQLLNSEINSDDYASSDVGVFCLSSLDDEIRCVEEAFFKLQLLSQRHVKPHQLNLNKLFGTLNNLAWTNKGPILLEDLDYMRIQTKLAGDELGVSHVDKFPYLVNYHVPSGVRIAAGSQVRLGAYLGEGTTVMPAGYINFNAGTIGNAMVEGRISAGVVVDAQTDIGGGASIMGTLSGGNDHVISVGKKCLLGANSGIGISLGDGCTVAAGLYVYSGKKVYLLNKENEPVNLDGTKVDSGKNVVKASQLSGRDYLLFIEDSQTGQLFCKPNSKLIELNESLHVN